MDSEQRKKIAIEIYEQTGVMYDEKDPVFALAIIAGQVQKNLIKDLEEDYRSLNLSINQLPGMIESSISKLASGVEEAERSYDLMAHTHRAVLQNQLDESKLEIRKLIASVFEEGLRDAHQELNQLARKAESVNKQASLINNKSWIAVIVMGLVTFFSISAVLLMASIK